MRDVLYVARLLGTWALVKLSYVPAWLVSLTVYWWGGAVADGLLVVHHVAWAGDMVVYAWLVFLTQAYAMSRKNRPTKPFQPQVPAICGVSFENNTGNHGGSAHECARESHPVSSMHRCLMCGARGY